MTNVLRFGLETAKVNGLPAGAFRSRFTPAEPGSMRHWRTGPVVPAWR